MEGEHKPKIENSVSEQLLFEFKNLFGLISSQENNDLQAVAEKVKRLIFNQLVKTGKVDPEKDYNEWAEEVFPVTELQKPTLLITMAEEYNLINPENTSDILRKKLIQLLNDYRNRNLFGINQALIAEIEEAVDGSEVTTSQYDTLASRLLSMSYGG